MIPNVKLLDVWELQVSPRFSADNVVDCSGRHQESFSKFKTRYAAYRIEPTNLKDLVIF